MELTFRKAERSDTEFILKFIKELAEYEKMQDEVVADVDNFSTFLGRAGIY